MSIWLLTSKYIEFYSGLMTNLDWLDDKLFWLFYTIIFYLQATQILFVWDALLPK